MGTGPDARRERWALRVAAGLVTALFAAGVAAGETGVERLERAVAEYPDDPDLVWALAGALERADRPAEAADRVEDFVARWPDRRPGAALRLGRLHYGAGNDAGALDALDAALARDPAQGSAHFFRGLVLRRLGRGDEASDALDRAGEISPELRASSLLLRGLDLIEDDPDAAQSLLRESAELDASGEIGRLSRAAVRNAESARGDRRAALFASAGWESDTNVTLEGDSGLGSSTGARDTRLLWSAGLRLWPLRSERGELMLGYRFDQSFHEDLEAFDQQTHQLFAAATWRIDERLSLRLDGLLAKSFLDGERYARAVSALPSLFITLPSGHGLLRFYAEATRRGYFDDPIFSSLERDGLTLGLGAAHYASLPWVRGAWGSLGARVAHTDTDADPDPLGFRGDYDRVRWESSARLHLPVVYGVAANLSLLVSRDRYGHHNLIDALTANGVGTTDPDRRRDTVLEGRIAFERKLTDLIGIELAWRYRRQFSNVDVYDYDRHVFGIYFKTEI